jgi:hypothetical protein
VKTMADAGVRLNHFARLEYLLQDPQVGVDLLRRLLAKQRGDYPAQ